VHEPSRVFHASAADLKGFGLPAADLVFTSPPYSSFRKWNAEGFATYWEDFSVGRGASGQRDEGSMQAAGTRRRYVTYQRS
jgi:DNA modification methylase